MAAAALKASFSLRRLLNSLEILSCSVMVVGGVGRKQCSDCTGVGVRRRASGASLLPSCYLQDVLIGDARFFIFLD